MRWHRELPNFHRGGFAVSSADAPFLEGESRVFRGWRGRHLLYKRVQDSHNLQYRHAVRRKLKPSADVPFLLWPIVLYNVDCLLPTHYFRDPSALEKN